MELPINQHRKNTGKIIWCASECLRNLVKETDNSRHSKVERLHVDADAVGTEADHDGKGCDVREHRVALVVENAELPIRPVCVR